MSVLTDDLRDGSVVPERSLAQRMEALAIGNAVRMARAERKRELKRREVSVTELLADVPPELVTMKVFDLVVATPGVGPVKAAVILRRELISPSKTVAGLSKRQRQALTLALMRYGGSVRQVGTMES